MDSGASSHMASNSNSLASIHPPNSFTPSNIIVGNGSLLPVTGTGTLSFFTLNHPLYLHNILISPEIIKTLIYVRRFTTGDHCSVEFDPFGLSVKDLTTRNVIVRCNSSRELYSFRPPTQAHLLAATTSSTVLWHRRLGHLGQESLSCLGPSLNSVCNISELEILCHACQLGRHVCLPFTKSNSRALKNFDLIHCDLWTSPVASITSYKYYLIILDDCSHHSWTFSLRLKSDTFPTLSIFFSYVTTQFGTMVKSVQCDNGQEFDNASTRSFLLTHGATIRMSCPHTSLQNGRVERIIRTTNDIMHSLMFQASLPASYWAKALHTATYLLNRHPTKTLDLNFQTLHFACVHPSYDHLRVFGCKCYPNLSATAPHKLVPRSSPCVFLGYPSNHKGYCCLDLATNRLSFPVT
jgi:hypothetical protein